MYSVLMAVYRKENPRYLQDSMESMFRQTLLTNDFVLVCDGPLGEELNEVIAMMQKKYGDILNVVRLEKNSGLGNALNEGMKHCKNSLIARMDSDDISFDNRCEKQVAIFTSNPEISIVSGTVLEFQSTVDVITGKRALPEQHSEICFFSRKRNPFNHPAVMLRKESVEQVGGYKETFPLFEDYYLWVRMLQHKNKGYNLQEPLVYMRTSVDMYLRRGGVEYAKRLLKFHSWIRKSGWSNRMEYWCCAVPHALVCILPNKIRQFIYTKLHKY